MNSLNSQNKPMMHYMSRKADFLVTPISKGKNKFWDETSDVDVLEQKKTYGVLTNMLYELSKLSDPALHLAQEGFSGDSNLKVTGFHQRVEKNFDFPLINQAVCTKIK